MTLDYYYDMEVVDSRLKTLENKVEKLSQILIKLMENIIDDKNISKRVQRMEENSQARGSRGRSKKRGR